MLVFPGHFGVGLIFSGLTGLNTLLVLIGSILPDLDVLPYFFGIKYRKTHRTFMHSIFFPLLILPFSAPLCLGILVHLLMDLMTYPGLKLFYPLSNREIFLYKGSFKKYEDFILFLKDIKKDKKYLAFEIIVFLIGCAIYLS